MSDFVLVTLLFLTLCLLFVNTNFSLPITINICSTVPRSQYSPWEREETFSSLGKLIFLSSLSLSTPQAFLLLVLDTPQTNSIHLVDFTTNLDFLRLILRYFTPPLSPLQPFKLLVLSKVLYYLKIQRKKGLRYVFRKICFELI